MLDGFRVPRSRVWHLGLYGYYPDCVESLCGKEYFGVQGDAVPSDAKVCKRCRTELERLLGGRYEIREREQ